MSSTKIAEATAGKKNVPGENVDDEENEVYLAPVASADSEEDIEDVVLVASTTPPDSATAVIGQSLMKSAGQIVIATEQKLMTNIPYRISSPVDIIEDGFLVIALDNGYSIWKGKEVTIRVTDGDLALFPDDKANCVEKTYSTLGTMIKGRLQIMLDQSKFEKIKDEGAFRVQIDPKSDQKIFIHVKRGQRIRLEMSVSSYDVKFSVFLQVDAYHVM
eukprot:g4980.t1